MATIFATNVVIGARLNRWMMISAPAVIMYKNTKLLWIVSAMFLVVIVKGLAPHREKDEKIPDNIC